MNGYLYFNHNHFDYTNYSSYNELERAGKYYYIQAVETRKFENKKIFGKKLII